MSHQFNPGDLALIIGGSGFPLNVGRQCTLIVLAESGVTISNPRNAARYTYIGEEVCWLVDGQSIENDSPDLEDAGLDIIEQKYLIPLRGDFAPEQQKVKEAEPCA